MKTYSNLYPYQIRAIKHQCEHHTSMLWLDMGLGKTIITLTALDHLLKNSYLRGVLVVAPKMVALTGWSKQALDWEHVKHLNFSMIMGNRDQRTRALVRKADIYVINYENLHWLSEILITFYIKKGKEIPFNGLVWDEVNKMKNSSSTRSKAMRKLLQQFNWVTGLTGTPASNGYKDLHGQYLVVDGGSRLGTSKRTFTSQFYYRLPNTFIDVPFKDTESRIKEAISDITLEMSAEDYNPLPQFIVNDIWLELPAELLGKYKKLEAEFFLKLDDTTIDVFSKPAAMNKCLQFANGMVYPVPGISTFMEVHDLKLQALERIVDESNGNPILCSYAYKGDAERIVKNLKALNLTDAKTPDKVNDALTRWKMGKVPLMVGHPLSMGHGVDGLQHAGHILVWFGLTWSLDQYKQFNARVLRQGQTKPVICHRILIKDTLDEAQRLALESKDETEVALKKAINEYRSRF